MVGKVKRSYVSATREAQARATRSAIVNAALELFTANGYVATTIKAIAEEAGVAEQTVYAAYGTKRELLRRALEAAVAGDAHGPPLAGRPETDVIRNEPDPHRRVALDAAMSARIASRIAPVARVLREAATVDPEFAETTERITAQRRADMTSAARVLAGDEGLQVSLEDAVGTLYVLYGPETFTALTEGLGWSVARYERWLATMLFRTLLA